MQPNSPMVPGNMPPNGVMPPQPQSASQMKKQHISLGWIITTVVLLLLLLGVGGFAAWAFMERGKYKNDTDAIVAKEVALAEQRVSTAKDAEFVEAEKKPTKAYKGPSTFGSVELEYPKTWSAFITESGQGNTPIDGYLHPNFVPGTQSGTQFALRLEVVQRTYDDVLKQFDSKVRQGKVAVSPFRAEHVPDVLGARVEGEINQGQKNLMVLFPIRDKTLKISTESETFFKDFNEIILKTLKFVP